MASIHTEANGCRRILLKCPDGRRRPIRLGRIGKKDAEAVKRHVEHLFAARMSGQALPTATAEWLGGVPTVLRERLERVGLVEPRAVADVPTVAAWCERYVEMRRPDMKPGSAVNLEQAAADLRRFFGASKRLDEVTPGDAEELRAAMKGRGLSEATVRRKMKRAKQFFAAAARKRLLAENPFADVKCGRFANPKRRRFVTRQEIAAVLEQCPSVAWPAAEALARYGG